MLNVYVLVHLQLGLLYTLVAMILYFSINISFQLFSALQVFLFNGPPMFYEIQYL
jgi:hypothetical protein